MIALDLLKFKGIARFNEIQEINFSNRSKLFKVFGQNNMSNGSSGSGKSSIVNCIDYLLGTNETPVTVLKSRKAKGEMFVEGHFRWIDPTNMIRIVIIKRGTSSGLSVEIDGSICEGDTRIVEEKIDQMIGMDRSIFRKMYHKKQGEGGFFLSLTPKKMYEFLISSLELDHLTSKLDKLDKANKDFETSTNELNTKKTIKSNELSSSANILNDLKDPEKPSVNIEEDKENLIKLEDLIVDLNKNKETQLSLVEKPALQEVIEPTDKLNELGVLTLQIRTLKNEILEIQSKKREAISKGISFKSKLEQEINSFKSEVKEIVSKERELPGIEENIKKLEKQTCPTCDQGWALAHRELDQLISKKNSILDLNQKKIDLLIKVKDHQDNLTQLNYHLDKLNNKDSEEVEKQALIENLQKTESALNSEISKYKDSIKISNLEKSRTYSNLINEIKNKFNQDELKLIEIKSTISQALLLSQTSLKNYDNKLKENQQLRLKYQNVFENANKEMVAIEEKLVKLNKDVELNREAYRLIKSYSMECFYESLDYIGSRATQFLASVPNMRNASLMFDVYRETAKGAVKEELNMVLNIDGDEGINIKSLSGGERTAVNLAVDIAVIDMLESRIGKGMNIMFLDEPFNGLGSVEIEPIIEMIKNIDISKKVCIIDHNAEINEMISDTILVSRENDISFIQGG